MRPLSHDIRVEIIPQLGVPGPKKVPATRCWSNYDMTVDSNLKRGQFCGVSNPFKDWRYQGRFDNDVLMSKGVLCANDHKVAWALGKRTIRIWSSLNCSQALQSNQLEESEACKEASHVFTCCVRRGYVSFELWAVSIFSEKTYFHGWSTMNRRTSWKDMNALKTFEVAFTGLDYVIHYQLQVRRI